MHRRALEVLRTVLPVALVAAWAWRPPASPLRIEAADPEHIEAFVAQRRRGFRAGALWIASRGEGNVHVQPLDRLGVAQPAYQVDDDWPPLRALWPELAACDANGQMFRFFLVARPEDARWESEVDSPGTPAEAACIEEALSRAPLRPLVAADTTLVISGELLFWPRPLEVDGPDWFESGSAGTFQLDARGEQVGGATRALFQLDDEGVRALHGLLACPSEVPLTHVELRWRGGSLQVRTYPRVGCVEARAVANRAAVETLLRARGRETDPSLTPRPAGASVDGVWPAAADEDLRFQVTLHLPEAR